MWHGSGPAPVRWRAGCCAAAAASTLYALSSLRRLRRSLSSGDTSTDYWQAGKSVGGIQAVLPAAEVVRSFAAALASSAPAP